jgi:hypothetical protein
VLSVYLNDHLAGATGAVSRARYAAGSYEGELGAFFSRLARELEQDRDSLRRVMAAAGVRVAYPKLALALAGERLGRLKPNGSLRGRSPLTPLVELEAIELGITGKLRMWLILREHRPPGSSAVDLDDLIVRAERQRDDVERHRIAAGAVLRG